MIDIECHMCGKEMTFNMTSGARITADDLVCDGCRPATEELNPRKDRVMITDRLLFHTMMLRGLGWKWDDISAELGPSGGALCKRIKKLKAGTKNLDNVVHIWEMYMDRYQSYVATIEYLPEQEEEEDE